MFPEERLKIMISKLSKGALGLTLIVAPVLANAQGVMFFQDQNSFRQMALSHGKTLKGIEDFEECALGPAAVAGMSDPLMAGVPNGPFLNGLTGLDNLIIQSNLGGANSLQVNPRGANGLAAASAGFGGSIIASDIVVANTYADSIDFIFTDPKTAVGGNPISVFAPGNLQVTVYDTFNNLIGVGNTIGTVNGGTFFGVISMGAAIGRINLFGDVAGALQAEGMDNIEAWEAIPEPGTMAALGLGALAFLKRRKKS